MKQHFHLKLTPHRNTFPQDITPEEQNLMAQHAAYMHNLMTGGEVVVFGPVLDPAGVFGLGVLATESLERADALAASDPARGLFTYQITPMQAVYLPLPPPSA